MKTIFVAVVTALALGSMAHAEETISDKASAEMQKAKETTKDVPEKAAEAKEDVKDAAKDVKKEFKG